MEEKFNNNINEINDYITKILTTFIIASSNFNSQLIVRDEKDTNILNSALSEKCTFSITGDNDLLTLKKVKSTRILTSTEFIKELKLKYNPKYKQ